MDYYNQIMVLYLLKNVTQDPIFFRTKNYKIGYVPQHGGYFHDLTLRDNLKAISEIVINDKKLREEKLIF